MWCAVDQVLLFVLSLMLPLIVVDSRAIARSEKHRGEPERDACFFSPLLFQSKLDVPSSPDL